MGMGKGFQLLVRVDHQVTNSLYESVGARVPRYIWKLLEYSGDGLVWLFITSLLLVLTVCAHTCGGVELEKNSSSGRYGLHVVGVNLLLGIVVDLVQVGILKGVCKRPRPAHNAKAKDMKLVVAVDAYSFPSGHSSRCARFGIYALLAWLMMTTPCVCVCVCILVGYPFLLSWPWYCFPLLYPRPCSNTW